MKLFGADGIRGTADVFPLNDSSTERIGRSIANWARLHTYHPVCLIGCDTRESSKRLKASLILGLSRSGVSIIDAGVLPTPAISYLVASRGHFSAGIVVSASHNPVAENGIKIFDHNGLKISRVTEQYIEKTFDDPNLSSERFYCSVKQMDSLKDAYARALAAEYRDRDWGKLNILLDCANGATSNTAHLVLDQLGIRYSVINHRPNGLNINVGSGSEYARIYPELIAEQLQKKRIDTAIVLDGDGDRLLMVDRYGHALDGDDFLCILSSKLKRGHLLRKNTVVHTQMANRGAIRHMQKAGIQVHDVHNGDRNVCEALIENNWSLGGEPIGHIIMRTNSSWVTGDGLRTALAVLAEQLDQNLDGVAALAIKKNPQVTVTVHLHERVVHQCDEIPGLVKLLQDIQNDLPDLDRPIECRPASTEAAYRLMIEARETTPALLKHRAGQIAQFIQKFFKCEELKIDIISNI